MDTNSETILARCGGLALVALFVLTTAAVADENRQGARCLGNCCRHTSDGRTSHCGMPAPSYPVPFATPRPNLQTNYTYPPMMPHNSLPHYAGTYAFRHGPGMSRTTVLWRPTTGINALAKLHYAFELPR